MSAMHLKTGSALLRVAPACMQPACLLLAVCGAGGGRRRGSVRQTRVPRDDGRTSSSIRLQGNGTRDPVGGRAASCSGG
jgi:hypothetical protein